MFQSWNGLYQVILGDWDLNRIIHVRSQLCWDRQIAGSDQLSCILQKYKVLDLARKKLLDFMRICGNIELLGLITT